MELNINPSLPPIEFCSIGRAANLLGCEPSDILHWWGIGYIELAVFLKNIEGELIIKARESHASTKMVLRGSSYNFALHRRSRFCFFDRKDNRDVRIIKITKEDDLETYVRYGLKGYVDGIWKIVKYNIRDYFYCSLESSVEVTNDIYPVNVNKGAYIASIKFNPINNLKINISDLIITRNYIELLLNAKGEELPQVFMQSKTFFRGNYDDVPTKKLVGKPANHYRNVIIDIARETRSVYPHCITARLIEAIHDLLSIHDPRKVPTKGGIRNILISQGIGKTGLETKEPFELVIPEQYKNELNN